MEKGPTKLPFSKLANVKTYLEFFNIGDGPLTTKCLAYFFGRRANLKASRPDGSCLFHSICLSLDAPYEYTPQHLRRQIVLFVAKNADFFYRQVSKQLAYEYGSEAAKGEAKLPGPFTFVEYLEHLLKDSAWGDQWVLYFVSCMWQLSVTIVKADTLQQYRIRHNNSWWLTDLVLLHCNNNHYVPVSK